MRTQRALDSLARRAGRAYLGVRSAPADRADLSCLAPVSAGLVVTSPLSNTHDVSVIGALVRSHGPEARESSG
jgi:hypothetical protein